MLLDYKRNQALFMPLLLYTYPFMLESSMFRHTAPVPVQSKQPTNCVMYVAHRVESNMYTYMQAPFDFAPHAEDDWGCC